MRNRSFWYVECLARADELEKAQLLFEKLLGYANHLGLYSDLGPHRISFIPSCGYWGPAIATGPR
jgi:hypothetical protein